MLVAHFARMGHRARRPQETACHCSAIYSPPPCACRRGLSLKGTAVALILAMHALGLYFLLLPARQLKQYTEVAFMTLMPPRPLPQTPPMALPLPMPFPLPRARASAAPATPPAILAPPAVAAETITVPAEEFPPAAARRQQTCARAPGWPRAPPTRPCAAK